MTRSLAEEEIRASTPVILIGGQTRTVVAAARSLGRRGIPVVHVAVPSPDGSARSRYVTETVWMPSIFGEPKRFAAELAALARARPGALLLPLNDTALNALARLAGELPATVRVGCPGWESVEPLLDKTATAALAASLDVPMPRTFAVAEASELGSAAAGLTFPVLAKPRKKADHLRRSKALDFGVEIHADLASLRAAFAADADYGRRMILQEYCAGHDVMLSVLMHEGRIVASCQAESLRTWPSSGGVTVLARTEPVDEAWRERLAAMLRAVRWEGVAQADLRRDPKTGRTVLLEINGRLWGSLATAVHAGVDFPYYLWQQAHGREVRAPATYRRGVRTRWVMGDAKRLVRLWRRRSAGESRLREVGRFVAAFRPGTRGMLWAWDDPAAAWSEWGQHVKWFLVARARQVRSRLGRLGRDLR